MITKWPNMFTVYAPVSTVPDTRMCSEKMRMCAPTDVRAWKVVIGYTFVSSSCPLNPSAAATIDVSLAEVVAGLSVRFCRVCLTDLRTVTYGMQDYQGVDVCIFSTTERCSA